MTKLKKSVSIILAVIMALSAFSAVSFAEEETDNSLKIGVCSDIHSVEVPDTEETYDNGMYGNGDTLINMHTLSFAIADSCAKSVKEKGGRYLFICGDITDMGTIGQYEEASKKLAEIEKKHGITILLVPGNHDYKTLGDESVKTFREYFYSFGYDEAFAIDENTNSYAYNLSDKYCLVALDTNEPGKTGDGMEEETYLWAENQVKAARDSGREVILMCHHPIMPHYQYNEIISNFILANYKSVCNRFADLGVKYAFTGHSHLSDIAKYESAKGNEIYDATTACLAAYPSEYRMVTFTDENVTFEYDTVKSIDTALIPGGYSEEALGRMENDFEAYANDSFYANINHVIKGYLSADKLLEMIGASNANITKEALEQICARANEVLFAPLYGEKDSFQAVAKNYQIEIPESDYETFADVVLEIIRVFYGMENKDLASDSAEINIAVTGVGILLTYVIADAPREIQLALINAVLSAMDMENVDLTDILIASDNNPKQAIKVLHTVIDPIADGILTDTPPADRNIVLPAYGEVKDGSSANGFISFLKKIWQFFKKCVDFMKKLFKGAK